MKSLLVVMTLAFGLQAHAAVKTLLYCKNIEQTDLRSLSIQESDDDRAHHEVQVMEYRLGSSSRSHKAARSEFTEGFINLSNYENITRSLVRNENGDWEVRGVAGDYKFNARTECSE